MKRAVVFWIGLVGVLSMSLLPVSAQQVSLDITAFQDEFPVDQYLFYLTGYESVLDELDLDPAQLKEMAAVRGAITVKHNQHKAQVRALKGKLDKQDVEDMHNRLYAEISDELSQIKSILANEQTNRLRQIAFQYFFVIKNRANRSVNVGRLLSDKSIEEGLQIGSMQKEMISRAYESLELGLSKIDVRDIDQHEKLISNAHKSMLGVLNEEQRREVEKVVGPPARALHRPSGN